MAKGIDERHNPNRKVSKEGMAGAITGAMNNMMRAKSPEDQAIYDDDQSAYLVGEIGKNLKSIPITEWASYRKIL